MRVVITGATGFLGKYIVREFASHGCDVVAFGRNAEIGRQLPDCTFVQGDFTVYADISRAVAGADVVVHAGALCNVWGKWQSFYNANVLGTKHVLDACREHGVSKFVFVSSCSVYSSTHDRRNLREEDVDETNRLNYYIRTKIMAEQLIASYGAQYGISYSIIRPHGIFGVGDTSIMPRLLKANQKIGIPLFCRGQNQIDIVCVENVAYSLWLCANTQKSGVYNITNGEVYAYRQMVDELFAAMELKPRYVPVPFFLAYGLAGILEGVYKALRCKNEPIVTRYTLTTIGVSQTLDISRAREELGYQPKLTLREGFEAYAKWWKENH